MNPQWFYNALDSLCTRTTHRRSRSGSGKRRKDIQPVLEALEQRDVPSTISGTVFNDLNQNQILDPGEPGMANWTVVLDRGMTTQAWVRTDANGHYEFAVKPGDHTVWERLRDSIYVYTTAGEQLVSLVSNKDNVVVNFGNRLIDSHPNPEVPINTFTSGPQAINQGNGPGRHAVATDANGNFVVVWAGTGPGDADGVFARRFNSAGATLDLDHPEFMVNTTTGGDQGFASVAMNAAGAFVVVWQGPPTTRAPAGFGDVKAQVFNSDGSRRGGEFLVSSKAFVHDVAMDDSGNFVVAYEVTSSPARETLYAQRFNAAGSAQGKAISLNTTNLANDQASLAMNSNGDFVVSWWGAFQLVDRFGRKQGSVVSIPNAGRTTVGMDAAGNFAIAWLSASSPLVMQAMMYNADGTLRVNTFPVDGNTAPPGYPVLAMAPDGAFSISWTASSGPYLDIYVMRFTADGDVETQPFVVNLTTNYAGIGAPVVAMANGKQVVVWSGPGPGDDAGIFGQLYNYPTGSLLQAEGGGMANHSSADVLRNAEFQSLVEEVFRRWQRTGLPADLGLGCPVQPFGMADRLA